MEQREIKFQFVIDNKHISPAITLDEFIKCGFNEEMIIESMEKCDCKLSESNPYCEGDCIKFENSSITGKRQFTGLKDKNGVDIYEGDIGSIPLYENVIVVWNENICAFQYAYHAIGKGTYLDGRMTNTLYDHKCKEDFEVIGNIYEHPELLTTKQ